MKRNKIMKFTVIFFLFINNGLAVKFFSPVSYKSSLSLRAISYKFLDRIFDFIDNNEDFPPLQCLLVSCILISGLKKNTIEEDKEYWKVIVKENQDYFNKKEYKKEDFIKEYENKKTDRSLDKQDGYIMRCLKANLIEYEILKNQKQYHASKLEKGDTYIRCYGRFIFFTLLNLAKYAIVFHYVIKCIIRTMEYKINPLMIIAICFVVSSLIVAISLLKNNDIGSLRKNPNQIWVFSGVSLLTTFFIYQYNKNKNVLYLYIYFHYIFYFV